MDLETAPGSASERELARRAAIALSLANLCWLRIWAELFTIASPDVYYQKVAAQDFAAAAAGTLLLGGFFLACWEGLRRLRPATGSRLSYGAVALVAVWQVSFVGHRDHPGLLTALGWWRDGRLALTAGAFAGAALLLVAAFGWRERIARAAAGMLLALSPFVLLTFGRAAWTAVALDPTTSLASRAPPIGTPLAETPGPRLVVVLFDELDRRVAFDERPEGLELPAFDALRREAIDATSMRQATPKTKMSIPATLSGMRVTDAVPSGASELIVSHEERGVRKQEPFSALPGLLGTARERGGVAVVAGWYHPYCRIFPDLSACSWYPSGTRASHGQDGGFLHALADQGEALVPYVAPRLRHAEVERQLAADATWAVTAGSAGVVFIHLPIPHKPWIHDRETGEGGGLWFPAQTEGYLGNLVLADSRLGELRHAMERVGKWEGTAVLVTSDHGWREGARKTGDARPRIPWILKPAGKESARLYARELTPATTYPVLDALLRGEARTADEIVSRLDAAANAESAFSP